MSGKERKTVDYQPRLGMFSHAPTIQDLQPLHRPEIEQKISAGIKKIKKIAQEEDELPKINTINVKTSPSLHQKFKIFCAKENISMQDYLLKIVRECVENDEKKNK